MVPTFVSVVVLVAIVLGGLATVLSRPSKGPQLSKGLATLGDMIGRTEADFVTAFRLQPTSISSLAHGQRLLQWQTGGQHLAILFTADHRFVQITHRHRV